MTNQENRPTQDHQYFMRMAIEEARKGMNSNDGGPFGAVIINSKGKVVGLGHNMVMINNDPTAHAEVVAIRNACQNLGTFQLEGCTLYTSCEPCPMCLGAIYWARPERVFFGCSKQDAAAVNFDDAFIYQEIEKPLASRVIPAEQLLREEALQVFEEWMKKEYKMDY
jgi:tRNA(Arg) A34 adenosine deaminase TadA